jgi:hypothetical protein
MKYSKKDFEKLVNEILVNSGFNVSITFHLIKNQEAKKWYEIEYTSDFENIEENTRYGISFGDRVIEYDFKTGKIDSLLKSFLNSFANKYRYTEWVDGSVEMKADKKRTLEKIISSNQNRVYRGLFYTTLYGIGFWALFSSKQDVKVAKELHEYLKGKSIQFKNEWSDAGWVYRFVINSGVEIHNQLLLNFKF